MLDWLAGQRYRLCWCLCIYFSLHALVRTFLSQSLAYDEAEQVYLAQWVSLGYNSQPPLYTWLQSALFQLFGTSVFTLALLKNALLLGTYLFTFGFVRQATGDVRAAIIATLGLVTIPQIGYESHRDLSHTVAVTMATMALFFSVVGVARNRSTGYYLAVGLATAFGVMSKYNFAMIVVAIVLACLTLSNYRRCLLDRRLLIGIALVAVLIFPHAIWMAQHPGLVTEKTVSQLTEFQTTSWFGNVRLGLTALVMTSLGCCGASLAIFSACFYRSFQPEKANSTNVVRSTASDDVRRLETALLLERFLLIIASMLIVMVVSGNTVEFMNRWFQPFIVVIPAYVTLRFLSVREIDRRAANRLVGVCAVLMLLFTTALIARPISAGWRERYSWLNMPYGDLASKLRDQIGAEPRLIIANDMRTAGNMKLCFPHSGVASQDNDFLKLDGVVDGPIVLVADILHQGECDEMVRRALGARFDGSTIEWQTIKLGYVYGQPGCEEDFYVAVLKPKDAAEVYIGAIEPASKTR